MTDNPAVVAAASSSISQVYFRDYLPGLQRGCSSGEWRGGECVCVASPLKGTLDAWKITREMSLTFIVAVRQHTACIWSQSSLYTLHASVWYCIVESRPHCWDQRGSHLLFFIAPRIHNNERGVRYHSRLLAGEKVCARPTYGLPGAQAHFAASRD